LRLLTHRISGRDGTRATCAQRDFAHEIEPAGVRIATAARFAIEVRNSWDR